MPINKLEQLRKCSLVYFRFLNRKDPIRASFKFKKGKFVGISEILLIQSVSCGNQPFMIL